MQKISTPLLHVALERVPHGPGRLPVGVAPLLLLLVLDGEHARAVPARRGGGEDPSDAWRSRELTFAAGGRA